VTLHCHVCQADTDAMLCRRCLYRLERILAELPSWLSELQRTETRQSNTSGPDGGKPTKRAEQPLPFDARAVVLAEQARNGLSSWIRHLCEQRGLTTPKLDRTAHMAVWLTAHVAAIAQDEAAADCYTAMVELRRALMRHVDNLGKRWAGPCTAMVDEYALSLDSGDQLRPVLVQTGTRRQCGADLRTRPGSPVIICAECGAEYDPIERAQWTLGQSRDHLDSAAFIAHALTDAGYPVKRNTITMWARREKLFAWREDDLGRPLYRVGDVLDLVLAARRTAA